MESPCNVPTKIGLVTSDANTAYSPPVAVNILYMAKSFAAQIPPQKISMGFIVSGIIVT
jgi:hypothetical protein